MDADAFSDAGAGVCRDSGAWAREDKLSCMVSVLSNGASRLSLGTFVALLLACLVLPPPPPVLLLGPPPCSLAATPQLTATVWAAAGCGTSGAAASGAASRAPSASLRVSSKICARGRVGGEREKEGERGGGGVTKEKREASSETREASREKREARSEK